MKSDVHPLNNLSGHVLLTIQLRCARFFQTTLPPKVFIYNRIGWEQAVSIDKADLDNTVFQFAGNTSESGFLPILNNSAFLQLRLNIFYFTVVPSTAVGNMIPIKK